MQPPNADRCDERAAALLLYSELIEESQALGAALLDRDGGEARFRTALIAGRARSQELSGVANLADDLGRRLEDAKTRPGIGVGASYDRLSRALGLLLDDA